MTQAIPQTQQPRRSLSDIFNAFAADAVERFPDLKGRLLILDMNEYKTYGSQEIDSSKTGLTPEEACIYLGNHPKTKEMLDNKNVSSCSYYDRQLRLIMINDRVDTNNISANNEKHLLLVLDHELAHLAIQNAYPNTSLHTQVIAESIADAYALIRHYQRFGINSKYRDKPVSPENRAHEIIFTQKTADANHCTTFVLEAIIKRKHMIDFDNLTPIQTVDLAWRFAMKYALPEAAVTMLHETFEPVREAFKKSFDAGCKTLAELILHPNIGYYTFKIGSYYLHPLLEDSCESVELRGEYWDGVRRKLKERKFKFAQEDILFNMPLVKPRPANQNAHPKLSS